MLNRSMREKTWDGYPVTYMDAFPDGPDEPDDDGSDEPDNGGDNSGPYPDHLVTQTPFPMDV